MNPEPVALSDPERRSTDDRLALTLLTLAADQDVRVLEALAACLINRARRPQGSAALPPVAGATAALAGAVVAGDFRRKLQISRRIARRALRGSLADPTRGATAFHRIDATPGWARELLPVAIVGGFLFYEPPVAAGLVAKGETPLAGR